MGVTQMSSWEKWQKWIFFACFFLNIASHKSQFVNHHSVVCQRTEKPSLAGIKVTVYKAPLRVGGSYFFPGVHCQCPTMKKKSSELKNIIILMIKRSGQQHQKWVLSQTTGMNSPKILFCHFIIWKFYIFAFFSCLPCSAPQMEVKVSNHEEKVLRA